jgi:asparagine synthase (glutamine-hydrolysing)
MVQGSPHLAEMFASSAIGSLKHRGPDGSGLEHLPSQPCIVGHTRLAILDLGDAASQPMSDGDKRFWITFNGEIYNFRELREQLESEGRVFSSTGDTEVLLQACTAWGIDRTVRNVRGMFAFALVDQAKGTVTLARDRFGEKPLYFRITDGTLLFGSEIKALLAPNMQHVLDDTAVSDFLELQYCPSPETCLEDVEMVRPGHYVEIPISSHIRRADVSEVCFFDVASVAMHAKQRAFSGSLEEASGEFLSLLDETVARQMLSDVPLGAFLSGGIDSSLVASSMAKVHNGRVATFSIGFADSDFDESHLAREVAHHLGTRHTEFVVTESDALSVIPLLPQIYDDPFADSSAIPTYLLSKLTREHVTVALSGDGGDELFGGYNRYFLGRGAWQLLSKVPRPLRRSTSGLLGSLSSGQLDRLGQVVSFGGRKLFDGRLSARTKKIQAVLDSNEISDLYTRIVRHRIPGLDDISRQNRWLPTSPAGLDPAEMMMLWDVQTYLCGDILTKVDRAAMANSLETRVPFLDYDLFEFAWSLPLNLKVSGSQGKLVLKEALSQRVPREIWERPKRGFAIPLADWLRAGLKEWAEDLLFESSPYERLFDRLQLKTMWIEHQSGDINHQDLLWTVLMLKMWLNYWTPVIQSR